MMKPLTKPEAMDWINALRSDKYTQSKESLQDDNGFCCLGVLCDITKKDKRLDTNGFLKGAGLDDQRIEFSNLKATHLADKNNKKISLSGLNDDGLVLSYEYPVEKLEPFTFDEIADIIQAIIIEEVTL